ncbi:iron complex transport system permease protein [Desulfitobacterium chlororespirans DSM 11544]|uniref:Iron complex transport system permease protein n=2 Tax=Desulfitobacterium chlororespirans TaxID=51616 RepID=A0A1M7UR23_9FIRM|nr:iron complex transport system permease protein [Desulfitobacterium chlororespirans DSM 11544]
MLNRGGRRGGRPGKILGKAGYGVLILTALMCLALAIMLSVSIGIAGSGFKTLLQTVVLGDNSSNLGRIMLEMRLPRALAACLTGAAFALAGAIMQGITRNPLADAGLLGINAGAGFAVALGAVLWPSLSSLGTMLTAFGGAALAVLLVYGLGMGKQKSGAIRLILAGAAVGAFLTALSQGVGLTFGLSKDLSFWTSGSLAGISWAQLNVAAPWIAAAGVAGLLLAGRLSILALGEESAAGLGVNVGALRLTGLGVVLVLAGASVSLAGGISFLGLIIPHTARLLVGADYRKILPLSALLGGMLLVLSDVAARMINAPFDTPVGALVSVIGVPFFLVLTYRKKGA